MRILVLPEACFEFFDPLLLLFDQFVLFLDPLVLLGDLLFQLVDSLLHLEKPREEFVLGEIVPAHRFHLETKTAGLTGWSPLLGDHP
ncbi:hypothetical protein PM076_17490 [Halorubrum ezzemoulense]|uniref:Uncharacterized protein n=1 Tax=Halorubrum ezzemoulense TaxID=337243 RepID=A0ABT4Z760_HALEZ|nr:hypothetical protein [Halorubrum ezzemoulense]MDB2246500.1 hypothetical protein [Halorubrum ezzemoulense]MDB2280128.1 hypothetical protein [Halorubrum ezzemoulense]MDB2290546.1 hypothetical protein [Halorubrum ezzemoulense]MDB2294020.1 hypothetical protein [Halorubrum ezzemoulense]MDB2298030.1 hypothetical protein [Halorubrum ezzemoulense]